MTVSERVTYASVRVLGSMFAACALLLFAVWEVKAEGVIHEMDRLLTLITRIFLN